MCGHRQSFLRQPTVSRYVWHFIGQRVEELVVAYLRLAGMSWSGPSEWMASHAVHCGVPSMNDELPYSTTASGYGIYTLLVMHARCDRE